MIRTSADGHDSNRFTEGNPALSVPATVVDAQIMNSLQEEIVNVVLDQGITLDALNEAQLLEAIRGIVADGGVQSSQTIDNDVSSVTNITALLFDKATVKSAEVLFDIHRQTDSSSVDELGKMRVLYDPVADNWKISLGSSFDDAGVTFSINSSGQVQYLSTDITGANYSGSLRVTSIIKVKQ